jgi:hypothetical protein
MHLHLFAQPGSSGLYSAARHPVQYTASVTENKAQVTGVSADDFIAAVEGETAAVGFSPRKASLSLYGLTNAPEAAALLERLGKHKTGAGCLYINRLPDVDEALLAELISLGYRYGTTVLHSR